MDAGMVWFDDTERALALKVEEAARCHERRYGRWPNVCVVHPSMVTEEGLVVRGVRLTTERNVLPGNLWVGWEEKTTTNGERINELSDGG